MTLLGRPTYLSPYLGFTAILLLSSSCFVTYPELPKRNSTKIGLVLESKCDLKMHVRNLGYTLGAQNHLFLTTSQLSGNFNGLYLPNETRCTQSGKGVDNYIRRLKVS